MGTAPRPWISCEKKLGEILENEIGRVGWRDVAELAVRIEKNQARGAELEREIRGLAVEKIAEDGRTELFGCVDADLVGAAGQDFEGPGDAVRENRGGVDAGLGGARRRGGRARGHRRVDQNRFGRKKFGGRVLGEEILELVAGRKWRNFCRVRLALEGGEILGGVSDFCGKSFVKSFWIFLGEILGRFFLGKIFRRISKVFGGFLGEIFGERKLGGAVSGSGGELRSVAGEEIECGVRAGGRGVVEFFEGGGVAGGEGGGRGFGVEKLAEMLESALGAGHEQQAVGVAVEAVEQAGADEILGGGELGEMLEQKRDDAGRAEVSDGAGVGENFFGFVEEEEIGVIEQDRDRDSGGVGEDFAREEALETFDGDEVAGAEGLGFFGGAAVDADRTAAEEVLEKIAGAVELVGKPAVEAGSGVLDEVTGQGIFHRREEEKLRWRKMGDGDFRGNFGDFGRNFEGRIFENFFGKKVGENLRKIVAGVKSD